MEQTANKAGSVVKLYQEHFNETNQLMQKASFNKLEEVSEIYTSSSCLYFAGSLKNELLDSNNAAMDFFGESNDILNYFRISNNDTKNELFYNTVTMSLENNGSYFSIQEVYNANNQKFSLATSFYLKQIGNDIIIIGLYRIIRQIHSPQKLKLVPLLRNRKPLLEAIRILNVQLYMRADTLLCYVNRFLDTALSADQMHFCKKNIRSALDFSNMLLNDIHDHKDVALATAGNYSIKLSSVSIRELFNHVIIKHLADASKKQVVLNMDVDNQIPHAVMLDYDIVCLIFSKIIENTLIFKKNGVVTLGVKQIEQHENDCTLQFFISGVNLNEEIISLLLDTNTKTPLNSDVNSILYSDGGLWLTKLLIEALDSSIEIEKSSKSEYTVSFSVASRIPHNNEIHQGMLEGVRILSVDDSSIIQKIISHTFRTVGANVTTAFNGAEAIELFKKEQFDIILMDIEMPVINGYEAALEINRLQSGKKIQTPILALTPEKSEKQKQICQQHGILDIIVKPFSLKNMMDIITRTLDSTVTADYQHHEFWEEPEIKLMIDCIQGIDYKKGLQRVQGNESLYYELLGSFRDGYKHVVSTLQNLLQDDKEQEMLSLLHVLKGVSSNLELTDVYECVMKLYESVEQKNMTYILSNLQQFDKALQKFTESYDIVSMANTLKEGSLKDLDMIHVKTFLADLKKALTNDIDLGAALDISNELSDFMLGTKYEHDFLEIRHCIENINLSEAASKLTVFIEDFK